MRRNISNGRFELWRLFMTDADSLPVKKMSKSTSHRELRSSHRKSPFNDPSRRVKISRFWNEDYLASSFSWLASRLDSCCKNAKLCFHFVAVAPDLVMRISVMVLLNHLSFCLLSSLSCDNELRSVNYLVLSKRYCFLPLMIDLAFSDRYSELAHQRVLRCLRVRVERVPKSGIPLQPQLQGSLSERWLVFSSEWLCLWFM